jgi:hypothetical protein
MLALILSLVMGGPTIAEIDKARESLRPFLDAVAVVESNGKDDAVGDNGKALGRYQVWQVYWQDAVDYCPEIGGEYKDVTSKVYAERIVVAYLMRYGRKYIADSDFQSLARIHNGGPKGYKAKGTLKYWRKVSAVLNP